MTDEVGVRSATIADAEVIAQIASETWTATYADILGKDVVTRHLDSYYAVEPLRWRLASREAAWLIGELSGGPVGYSSLLVAGGEAEMVTLYVLPRAQRQGVGRSLIERVCELAREEGATKLRVKYAVDNEAAAEFYARVGLCEISRRRRESDGTTIVTAAMAL